MTRSHVGDIIASGAPASGQRLSDGIGGGKGKFLMRISDWAAQWGVSVEECQGQPGEVVLRVRDIFTTRNGSWEPNGDPGSVPGWARADYLKPANSPGYNDDAGADHHLFGAVRDSTGFMQPWGTFRFWTYTDNGNQSEQRAKMHGWANIPIWGVSETPGPWAWQPVGKRKADVVKGGGLPGGLHVSWFVVWEPVTIPAEEKPLPPKPEEPQVPGDLAAVWAEIRRLDSEVKAIKQQLEQQEGGK